MPEARLGLFGGAFDPPHRGHVELLRRARAQLGLERLIVLVVADPGHKEVDTPADVRLRLARAAFPHDEVLLDRHARTVDTLRAHPEWHDPVFLIGADEFCAFASWKEPDEVLRLARLGVATRPGFPRERLDAVLRLRGTWCRDVGAGVGVRPGGGGDGGALGALAARSWPGSAVQRIAGIGHHPAVGPGLRRDERR